MRGMSSRPTLYVGDDAESERALALLKEWGIDVEVRSAPSHYQVAYGTPVLFGFSNRYEGLMGVNIFIENARVLGHYPRAGSHNPRPATTGAASLP